VRGTGDATMQSGERGGTCAAGQPNLLRDFSDGSDAGKFLLVTRHEQNAFLLGYVYGERKRHARENDCVI
jgi:hypothetical protein